MKKFVGIVSNAYNNIRRSLKKVHYILKPHQIFYTPPTVLAMSNVHNVNRRRGV
jgi:hypothetical protein